MPENKAATFSSWDERTAHYLREFLVDPDQMVEMPAGEAVELCRAGRDFETMLGLAATTPEARMAAAERYLRASGDPQALELASAVAALRVEREETLREVLGEKDDDGPVPAPADPGTVAAIHERVTVPREELLRRQREKARGMDGASSLDDGGDVGNVPS